MECNSETTRIAVMTDIHGNLPALKQSLAFLDSQGCETIYVLGDSIAIGPFPRETMDLLLGLANVKMVLGNHELYYIHGLDRAPSYMQPGEVSHQKWVASQLGESYKRKITSLPLSLTEKFYGTAVSFQHYGIRDHAEEFFRFAPIVAKPGSRELDEMFRFTDVDLVFYGHEHSPSDVKGSKHYVNPGSLGCSKDCNARLVIVDFHSNGRYTINKIEAPYEKDEVFAELKARNVPERHFISKVFFGGNEEER